MNTYVKLSFLLLLFLVVKQDVDARVDSLQLRRERREHIEIANFGLTLGGHISVAFGKFNTHGHVAEIGFSIRRAGERSAEYKMDMNNINECFLVSDLHETDLKRIRLNATTGDVISAEEMGGVKIDITELYDDKHPEEEGWKKIEVSLKTYTAENMYTVSVNYCNESPLKVGSIDMMLEVEEVNPGPDYLGAGLAPVPSVYFFMSGLFGLAAVAWGYVLWSSRKSRTLYTVHYLMLALVITKTLSLIFHGIDYQIIKNKGTREKGWAVTYYTLNLAKGLILFLAILLIGAGYGFIKHALSKNERTVFLIVLPLQVFANIAYIVIEESAEGSAARSTWRSIGLLVDLLCCGAILFPLVWSIHHLREAAESDGKAAASLVKLRLFRRFYVMVLAYIYTTRIIVYLIESTMPFRYQFVGALFNEVTAFLFYVTTAYMFSPEEDNEYLHVPSDVDSDEENQKGQEETSFMKNGASEGLKRIKTGQNGDTNSRSSTKAKLTKDLLEPDF
eukprot:m.338483 g.338483  ORF g.338483 m.338483 type:complete len:505 (-) comp18435_c0_seq1:125-1639(-)